MPARKKVGELSNKRGGARPGAGRPSGLTKIKVSVSVDEPVWLAATAKWEGKPSRLVERLLKEYTETNS